MTTYTNVKRVRSRFITSQNKSIYKQVASAHYYNYHGVNAELFEDEAPCCSGHAKKFTLVSRLRNTNLNQTELLQLFSANSFVCLVEEEGKEIIKQNKDI